MAQNLNKERTLLFAFTNGSYKKITVTQYDHKEWITVTNKRGQAVYINPVNLKYIEEVSE